MARIIILNKKRYLFGGRMKLSEMSINGMLITSFILLVLFLVAVSRKHHDHKELKRDLQHIVLVTH
jgi:hypothetical protein